MYWFSTYSTYIQIYVCAWNVGPYQTSKLGMPWCRTWDQPTIRFKWCPWEAMGQNGKSSRWLGDSQKLKRNWCVVTLSLYHQESSWNRKPTVLPYFYQTYHCTYCILLYASLCEDAIPLRGAHFDSACFCSCTHRLTALSARSSKAKEVELIQEVSTLDNSGYFIYTFIFHPHFNHHFPAGLFFNLLPDGLIVCWH